MSGCGAAAGLRLGGRLGAAGLVLALLTGCGGSSPPKPSPTADELAVRAATAFLDHYVDPDGRVVRRDQGGDTVSEGEGYALLLAVATGDRSEFDRVWTWTRDHLQQPNGLLAYHWAGGRVVDAMPAADADTQTAWALTLAGRRWGGGYASAARRIATSVVAHEVGYDDKGRPVLAAGPWARGNASTPATVEPGYWTPPAASALAALTGDHRWQNLPGSMTGLIRQVSAGGHRLPADWVQIGAGVARPKPVGSPNGAPASQCGPDGQRTLVWAVTDPHERPLLPRWWRLVDSTATDAPLVRGSDGHPVDQANVPLSAVAAAAAAAGAGDTGAETSLLARADQLNRRYPTYYGAAWDALGRILLTTHRLAD